MKIVRFGAVGRERPGIVEDSGIIRDVSSEVPDWTGAHLAPAELSRLAKFDLKRLPAVSDPVRQAGGFYIFRADSITYTPLAEIRDTIFAQLQQMHSSEWLRNLDQNTKVEFPGKQPQPPGAAPSPPAGGQAK